MMSKQFKYIGQQELRSMMNAIDELRTEVAALATKVQDLEKVVLPLRPIGPGIGVGADLDITPEMEESIKYHFNKMMGVTKP